MLKFLVALALCLSALTAVPAEVAESRTAAMTLAATSEMVMTSTVRTAPSGTRLETSAAVPSESSHAVSWQMVLAALALMIAVALRRFRSGPR